MNYCFVVMANMDYKKLPDETKSDPKKEAGFFSLLTFWWMNGVFKTGAQRPLQESDFLPLQEEDETQRLTEKIQKLWNREKKKREQSGKHPRFWKCVLMAVSLRQLALIIFTALMDSACRVLQPLLLGFLVSEMMTPRNDRTFMYICAAGMFVVAVIKCLSTHHYAYNTFAIGMRLMAALKGVVYHQVSPPYNLLTNNNHAHNV